jgi:L-asparaginase II
MLATCVHLGLPLATYLDREHPLQRRILGVISAVTRTPEAQIRLATDGCSLPTFGTAIGAFATAYATLASPGKAPPGCGREHAAALSRVREAMTAHPENVAGSGNLVTDLMGVSKGAIVAKSGAEGLLCLAAPARGLGVAIRVLDGSFRGHAVIAARVLDDLRLVEPDVVAEILARHEPRVLNHNGRHVGDLRATFRLAN